MTVVSIINYKGGVGKTTVTANVATELAWRGKKVLLIDLDPQASLTFSFLTVDEWASNYADDMTIKNWYDSFIYRSQNTKLSNLIVRPPKINQIIEGELKLICSHIDLINIDLELAPMIGGGSVMQTANNFLTIHSRLRDGIDEVKNDYDYVLIDCPPNFNVVTRTAIVTSDWILIPAIPDHLSTLGIDQLRRHITDLERDFNTYAEQFNSYRSIEPRIVGVVPTMIQVYSGRPIATQRDFINRMSRIGVSLFDTYISRNNSLHGNAPQNGVPVVLQPVSGQTYVRVQRELEELTTEFIRRT